MSSEIFDQASLKHPKARRFAEAFEGCGEWITLPSRRGESSVFDFRHNTKVIYSLRINRPSVNPI